MSRIIKNPVYYDHPVYFLNLDSRFRGNDKKAYGDDIPNLRDVIPDLIGNLNIEISIRLNR